MKYLFIICVVLLAASPVYGQGNGGGEEHSSICGMRGTLSVHVDEETGIPVFILEFPRIEPDLHPLLEKIFSIPREAKLYFQLHTTRGEKIRKVLGELNGEGSLIFVELREKPNRNAPLGEIIYRCTLRR